jgi:hypothetical protein
MIGQGDNIIIFAVRVIASFYLDFCQFTVRLNHDQERYFTPIDAI